MLLHGFDSFADRQVDGAGRRVGKVIVLAIRMINPVAALNQQL
jgi:hypothetical protein